MSIDISDPAPGNPEMIFDDLSLSASEVSVGDAVTVTAHVRNGGDAPGNYTANFRVEETVSKTKQGSLLPGETRVVTFSESFETSGRYNLAINNLPPTVLIVGSLANSSPVAAFSSNLSTPTVGTALRLNGKASNDPNGAIRKYEWDLDGDNTTDATGEIITHTYNSPGSYDVTLTVTDTDGVTNTTTQPVSVVPESESESPVDEYDANNDSEISIIELGQAGQAFASGELTITELGEVGAAFAS
jgi:PKD repeat protein